MANTNKTFGQAISKYRVEPGFIGKLFGAKPYVDPLDEEELKGKLDERLATIFAKGSYKHAPGDTVLPGSVHIEFPSGKANDARIDLAALTALAKAFDRSYKSPVSKQGERTVLVDDKFNPVAITKGGKIYVDRADKGFKGIKSKNDLFNAALDRARYFLDYQPPQIIF